MAVELRSVGQGTSYGYSVDITKPAGLTVGDLMIAHVVSMTYQSIISPANWSLIDQVDSGDGKTVAYWKIADSSDVAASTFTFGCSSSGQDTIGAITAWTGVETTDPVEAYSTNTGTTSSQTTGTITPANANCILLLLFGKADDRTSSNYYISTDNPASWSEAYDITLNGPHDSALAMGYATRPETTATGTGGSTASSACEYAAFMIAINSVASQTVNPSGVASSEVFGTPDVSHLSQYLSPGSVISAEAFGIPVIGTLAIPDSVLSSEATGMPSVAMAILPSGIISPESAGPPVLAGGATTKVYIDGENVTMAVLLETLKITSTVAATIDTAEFTLDTTRTSAAINSKSEVVVTDENGERLFAGYIANIDLGKYGISKHYQISAQDYTSILAGTIVNEVFENKRGDEVLAALFTEYLPDLDASSYVEADDITYDKLVLNRQKLSAVVTQIANESGYEWYIDYEKNLHYYLKEHNLAPFSLSDEPDYFLAYPYSQFSFSRNATGIRNLVTVVGGTYLSADNDFILPANGQSTEFLLPYKLRAPTGETGIQVYKNTGSDLSPTWTLQSVGIDYIHELADFDLLYNYQEKLLKFNTAPADLLSSIKITGRYDIPVLVRVRSSASYDRYGLWIEDKIVDPNINTREWAYLTGKAFLAQHAFAKENGGLTCTYDGLRAGMQVSIGNGVRAVNDSYLITEVSMRLLGGLQRQYQIRFGEWNPDLIELLGLLKARSEPFVSARDDEVLTELFERFETLGLTESVTITINPAGEYCWGPKTEGELIEAQWNLFTWG